MQQLVFFVTFTPLNPDAPVSPVYFAGLPDEHFTDEKVLGIKTIEGRITHRLDWGAIQKIEYGLYEPVGC